MPAADDLARLVAPALHGLVAREPGSSLTSASPNLGFEPCHLRARFDPREMIAACAHARCRRLQGLPEPIETLAGQEERIRNKGLAAHLWRLRTCGSEKRGCGCLCESGYAAVSRCRCTLLFCQRFD